MREKIDTAALMIAVGRAMVEDEEASGREGFPYQSNLRVVRRE